MEIILALVISLAMLIIICIIVCLVLLKDTKDFHIHFDLLKGFDISVLSLPKRQPQENINSK